MGDWYFVVKTIKGRRYLYQQRSWREGRRVRTQCFSLGPVDKPKAASRPFAPLSADEACAKWDSGDLVALRPKDLSEQERQAVLDYTDVSHHARLNGLLRGNEVLSPATVAESDRIRIKELYNALCHPKALLVHDVTLYRKCLVHESIGIGSVIVDTAFMSCTTDLQRAMTHKVTNRPMFKEVILKIDAKSGKTGYISASGLTQFDGEREIIRYGSAIIVKDIIEYEGNMIYIVEEESGEYEVG